MQFLTDFTVGILMAYLAVTNTTADFIIGMFTPEESNTTPELAIVDFTHLPSYFKNSIPDILLKSAKYQQAAVVGSAGLTEATTRDPLEAIVNIFCTFTTATAIRTTTGTGFFIDPDGVIMTNAHVAQFLLLEGTDSYGETRCIVRSGNPASPKYTAELLYIPPAWIQENAGVMNEAVPMGTGERDYALLYVSSSIDGTPLPGEFPALSFDSELLPVSTKNNEVTAAGYPAADLIKNGPNTPLLPKKAVTTVSELYTFGSNYADVFSIRGSAVGSQGASGGPVLNKNGDVIGMISTRGNDATEGIGSLRAITVSHIHRTILEETGFSLEDNLGGNLSYRAQAFEEIITPFLLAMLEAS